MNAAAFVVRGYSVIKAEGLKGIMTRVLPHTAKIDSFDTLRNVDTSTPVPLWKLKTKSPDLADAVRYQPIGERIFIEALASLPLRLSDYTFIDVGAGKGRTLILASEAGFKRVIGVEFDANLCATARRNLDIVHVSAEVIHESASTYSFPDSPTVAFLFNPFGPTALREVLAHLRPHSYLLYAYPAYPRCAEVIDFPLIHRTEYFAVWRKP